MFFGFYSIFHDDATTADGSSGKTSSPVMYFFCLEKKTKEIECYIYISYFTDEVRGNFKISIGLKVFFRRSVIEIKITLLSLEIISRLSVLEFPMKRFHFNSNHRSSFSLLR